MEVIVRPEAEHEIAEAYEYCLRGGERSGAKFLARIEDQLRLLPEFPERGRLVHGAFRRLLLLPYPFGLYYRISPPFIFVTAVLDLRQNPERISSILDSST